MALLAIELFLVERSSTRVDLTLKKYTGQHSRKLSWRINQIYCQYPDKYPFSDPIYFHLCVPLSVFSGKEASESLKLTETNWTSAGSKSLFIIRVTFAQLWGLGLGAWLEWIFKITRPWIHAAGSVAFINKNWLFSALFLTLFGLAPELSRQGRIYPSQNSRYTDFCIIPAGLVAGWQLHNPSVILRL